MPGKELCADLLTKSITQVQLWKNFREVVGLRDAALHPSESCTKRLRLKTTVCFGIGFGFLYRAACSHCKLGRFGGRFGSSHSFL